MTDAIPLKWARLQAAVLSAAIAGVAAAAQDNGAPPPQSARGERPDGPHGQQTLTADQTARVNAILKAYKPASVNAEDAKSIHRAFRDAGIRPGPGLHDAIQAAGFDPDKLRALDPPPPRPPREESGQGSGAPRP
jgi:Spy/CpxP family protein refolding chaperone